MLVFTFSPRAQKHDDDSKGEALCLAAENVTEKDADSALAMCVKYADSCPARFEQTAKTLLDTKKMLATAGRVFGTATLTYAAATILLRVGYTPQVEVVWARTAYMDPAVTELLLNSPKTLGIDSKDAWRDLQSPFAYANLARFKWALEQYEKKGCDAVWVTDDEHPFADARFDREYWGDPATRMWAVANALQLITAMYVYTTTGIHELRNTYPHTLNDIIDAVTSIPRVVWAAFLGDIKVTNALGGLNDSQRGCDVMRDVNSLYAPTAELANKCTGVCNPDVVARKLMEQMNARVAETLGGIPVVMRPMYLDGYAFGVHSRIKVHGLRHLVASISKAVWSEVKAFVMAITIGNWRRLGYCPGRASELPCLPKDVVLFIRDFALAMRV